MASKGLDTFPAFLLAYCGAIGHIAGIFFGDSTDAQRGVPVAVEGYYPIAILLLIAGGTAGVLLVIGILVEMPGFRLTGPGGMGAFASVVVAAVIGATMGFNLTLHHKRTDSL